MSEIRHVEATVHGRVLYEPRGQRRLLVGFHGYGETAEVQLAEAERIPGIGEWSVAAVQALHPFYTRAGNVVASWMTSLDRDLAIRDNVGYVRAILADLPRAETLVFLGFSQGVAMAFRAAAFAGASPAGVIALGGDVPPDIVVDEAVHLPPVLLARGERDDWYSEEKFKKDLSYLEPKTRVSPLLFDGGHEWTDAFRDAAGQFLASLRV
jgi:predicted esterase